MLWLLNNRVKCTRRVSIFRHLNLLYYHFRYLKKTKRNETMMNQTNLTSIVMLLWTKFTTSSGSCLVHIEMKVEKLSNFWNFNDGLCSHQTIHFLLQKFYVTTVVQINLLISPLSKYVISSLCILHTNVKYCCNACNHCNNKHW